MANPSHPLPAAVLVLLGLFVAWRLFRRMRRLVGRQHFRPARAWLTLLFFPLLALFLLVTQAQHPLAAAAELLGLGIGVALAVYGLRLTRWEPTAVGLLYTPNAHIGIALTLLMAVRVLVRLIQISSGSMPDPSGMAFVRSPLTLLIVGMLAGYYTGYAVGLLRRRKAPGKRNDGGEAEVG